MGWDEEPPPAGVILIGRAEIMSGVGGPVSAVPGAREGGRRTAFLAAWAGPNAVRMN